MKNYYAEELAYLRELGAEYAKEHPAVAPLLATRSTDPDVERLLEAMAFLCGLVHERLDQNFPEIVQGLLDITAPLMLKPSPSQTLVQFTPLPQARGVQKLAAGCQLQSVEVGGTLCIYTPPRDMPVYPIAQAVTTLHNVRSDAADVRLTLTGLTDVGSWWPSSLRLHVHTVFEQACQWFYLLLNHCTRIEVAAGSERLVLGPSALSADLHPGSPLEAFVNDETGRAQAAAGRIPDAGMLNTAWLRNYFILPEQFLFLKLDGLDSVRAASPAFEASITFHLQGCRNLPRDIPKDLLRCNVSPAINLFRHASDPFLFGQERQEYRLTPQKDSQRQLEIHTIQRVAGIRRGQRHHVYLPYTGFAGEGAHGTYTVRRARSQVNGRMEHYLCLLYDRDQGPQTGETLVTDLLCFHHSLPALLREGDICQGTDSSPAMATFKNILPPTPPMPAPDGADQQWLLYSCLHANMLPLSNTAAIREFLSLWLPGRDPDPTRLTLNRQRIDAVTGFAATPEERLHKGRPLRGQHLLLTVGGECYASQGQRWLLGLVLDEVLAQYATINTYTRLEVRNQDTGESLTWPPRLGSRRLL